MVTWVKVSAHGAQWEKAQCVLRMQHSYTTTAGQLDRGQCWRQIEGQMLAWFSCHAFSQTDWKIQKECKWINHSNTACSWLGYESSQGGHKHSSKIVLSWGTCKQVLVPTPWNETKSHPVSTPLISHGNQFLSALCWSETVSSGRCKSKAKKEQITWGEGKQKLHFRVKLSNSDGCSCKISFTFSLVSNGMQMWSWPPEVRIISSELLCI